MAGSTNIDRRLASSINRRAISVVIALLMVCCAIAYKLFLIHGVYGDKLSTKQYAVTHTAVTDMPQRGQIYDRFGYGLALNTPEVELWVDQKHVAWQKHDIDSFADAINEEPEIVANWFKVHKETYRRYSITDWSTSLRLRSKGLKGLHTKVRFRRFYPLKSASAHLLGKLNSEGKGSMGLEYSFEKTLAGDALQRVVKHDRHGRPMQALTKFAALKKQSVKTTIDHRVQHYAFEALKEMVEKSSAQAGSVVVLDRNGDIHAMVNYPSYDPNLPIKKIDSALKNRAYIDMFEPGSIIKPIAIAALLSDQLSDDTTYFTGNGKFKFMGHYVTDTAPMKHVALKDILIKSSNIAMVKMAQSVQNKHLISGLKDFMLFDLSGIHLFGEPVNHDYSQINRDSAAYLTASYGYGIHVTLLRIAHAYLILANDGLDPGVRIIDGEQVTQQRVIDKATAQRVNQMMLSAVMKNGTGRRARVKNVNVAGKTGTTHKHRSGGYQEDAHIASFVGFAPAEDPQYVVAVMLDEPKGNLHYGGTSCAPLFRDIMDYALKVRVVSPQIAYDKGVRDATSYN